MAKRSIGRVQAAARRRARTERMRYIFNRCALELSPSGHLHVLADEFGWHRSTFWKWADAGEMPRRKADVLVKRFGDALDFSRDDLVRRP